MSLLQLQPQNTRFVALVPMVHIQPLSACNHNFVVSAKWLEELNFIFFFLPKQIKNKYLLEE